MLVAGGELVGLGLGEGGYGSWRSVTDIKQDSGGVATEADMALGEAKAGVLAAGGMAQEDGKHTHGEDNIEKGIRRPVDFIKPPMSSTDCPKGAFPPKSVAGRILTRQRLASVSVKGSTSIL